MMQGVTQSLAGRACILTMMPLSADKIDGKEEEAFIQNCIEILNWMLWYTIETMSMHI